MSPVRFAAASRPGRVPRARQLVKHGEALFRAAPLQAMRIRVTGNSMPALAACPLLARLTALDLGCNHLTDQAVRTLTTSPHLASLTELMLHQNDIGPAGIQALAAWPQLARITTLDLSLNHFHGTDLTALFRSPHLTALTRLHLGQSTGGSESQAP